MQTAILGPRYAREEIYTWGEIEEALFTTCAIEPPPKEVYMVGEHVVPVAPTADHVAGFYDSVRGDFHHHLLLAMARQRQHLLTEPRQAKLKSMQEPKIYTNLPIEPANLPNPAEDIRREVHARASYLYGREVRRRYPLTVAISNDPSFCFYRADAANFLELKLRYLMPAWKRHLVAFLGLHDFSRWLTGLTTEIIYSARKPDNTCRIKIWKNGKLVTQMGL